MKLSIANEFALVFHGTAVNVSIIQVRFYRK